ncbi:GntR family transcriptional regulator [Aestuariivirga sp.]|uniref:GntR family transcriptional regulator n=1 Tax=Aestuariivirga sp. TaxID=2650926 RepID=UPI0025B8BDF3|nr:GntR family transcriptional regulator [Aestuariivirga sp.]
MTLANPPSRRPGLRIAEAPPTLRELALERLRTAIVEHHFPPGSRLTERDLCGQLGVSRSVVREVIRHLEAEGLVTSIPHHGPIVARLEPEAAEQIYEIRALLESTAAHDAAQSATPEQLAAMRDALSAIAAGYAAGDHHGVILSTTRFYEAMFAAGGKRVAWEVVKRLNSRISWLRAMTIASPGRATTGLGQMQKIFAAIEQRKPEAAAAASRGHVTMAAAIARALLREQAAGPPPSG